MTYDYHGQCHALVAHVDAHLPSVVPDSPPLRVKIGTADDPSKRTAIQQLIQNNRDIIATNMSELGKAVGVKHEIKLEPGPPIRKRPYRMPMAMRAVAKQQIDDMFLNGVIRPSSSPYSAPVILVPKKNGEKRFVVDYRALNAKTIRDPYPLPRPGEIIEQLGGFQYLSAVDLFQGFWQLEVLEEDKHKTAFSCHLGHFEFNRLPFGLTNSPATFQRALNDILRPVLGKFAMVYLDDIIIYSKTFEEHLDHLRQVFQLLRKANLKIKLEKCEFMKKELKYLGLVVSPQGITVDTKGIQPIIDYPAPTNVNQLRSVLGMANFYRKFIRSFSTITHPLTILTKKDTAWTWGHSAECSW